MSSLLLKFKSKDSPYGVTKETVRALAYELDISETMVVHLAISRLAKEVLPAYEIDDGQLTDADINHIRNAAEPTMPKGKAIKEKSLFVRSAIARMQVAPRTFNQAEWNALAAYDGLVASGAPQGRVPDNLEADDNE